MILRVTLTACLNNNKNFNAFNDTSRLNSFIIIINN